MARLLWFRGALYCLAQEGPAAPEQPLDPITLRAKLAEEVTEVLRELTRSSTVRLGQIQDRLSHPTFPVVGRMMIEPATELAYNAHVMWELVQDLTLLQSQKNEPVPDSQAFKSSSTRFLLRQLRNLPTGSYTIGT